MEEKRRLLLLGFFWLLNLLGEEARLEMGEF